MMIGGLACLRPLPWHRLSLYNLPLLILSDHTEQSCDFFVYRFDIVDFQIEASFASIVSFEITVFFIWFVVLVLSFLNDV